VQINYFATYKFRRTIDKFYVPITGEQLTSGQKDEKTESGVSRKVAVDGQRFDNRNGMVYCLREYLQTQCHHVSSCYPQCKSHGVWLIIAVGLEHRHLENPDKMYKIINVKDFQTCNNNMSVAEPRNQADEVLSKCTSMRTTTSPFL